MDLVGRTVAGRDSGRSVLGFDSRADGIATPGHAGADRIARRRPDSVADSRGPLAHRSPANRDACRHPDQRSRPQRDA